MRKKGEGAIHTNGYIQVCGKDKNKKRFLHRVIAEKVLGKPLPRKSVVHHVDNNPQNNINSNLVICPNQGYHNLIHQRMRAYEAGYPAHYLKCLYCKSYDDPQSMYVRTNVSQAWHRHCAKEQKTRKYGFL